MYQRVHRSRGIGLWHVLLIINAVIGGYLRKMRWSITFYETQTKQSYIFFNIFYVIKIKRKRSISKQRYCLFNGSVTVNVGELNFASVRMQAAERSHNFVVDSYSLQTTSTVVQESRCRSPSRSPSTNFIYRTSTPMRCRTVAVLRR